MPTPKLPSRPHPILTLHPSSLLLLPLFLATPLLAAGTFTPITLSAPGALDTPLLLSDGSLMIHSANNGGVSASWYKLTPDNTGSYINGSWTSRADMALSRLYFASVLMPNGNLFVAGGEYTGASQTRSNASEFYNPVTNAWTPIPTIPGNIGDVPGKSLANASGVIVGDIFSANTYIYHPNTNSWTTGPTKLNSDRSDEESWAKLPDGSMVTVNVFNQPNAQRYVPSLNAWFSAGTVPVALVDSASEIGASLLLPTGKVFTIGATGHTALYTPPPANTTATGSWAAGPDVPNGLGAKDAPAAIEPNGKILLIAGNGFNANSAALYEYDPVANSMSAALATPAALTSILASSPAYVTRMLVLPTGQILITSDVTSTGYIYSPTGSPDPTWKPTISSVTGNGTATFHITGLQLNGLDEGSDYGDDAANASNYPLIRLVSSTGVVSYARSYNFSSMGVATGTTTVSADFDLPAAFPAGTYSLFAVANGIPSDPFTFNPAAIPEPASLSLLTLLATPLLLRKPRQQNP